MITTPEQARVVQDALAVKTCASEMKGAKITSNQQLGSFFSSCCQMSSDLWRVLPNPFHAPPNNSLDRSPDESGCFASSVARRRVREFAPHGQL